MLLIAHWVQRSSHFFVERLFVRILLKSVFRSSLYSQRLLLYIHEQDMLKRLNIQCLNQVCLAEKVKSKILFLMLNLCPVTLYSTHEYNVYCIMYIYFTQFSSAFDVLQSISIKLFFLSKIKKQKKQKNNCFRKINFFFLFKSDKLEMKKLSSVNRRKNLLRRK